MKIIFSFLGVLVLLIGLNFVFGFVDVFYTKTVGKAKQNANREVYEQTNSFVKGKRMEAIKLYQEYINAETAKDSQAIKTVIQMDFADFDEDTYIKNLKLRNFIHQMKYQ